MKERNIFISHYNKDRDQVKRLMDRLEERPYFNFRSSTIDEDTQIKSKNERVIKEGLRPKIKWAGTVIVAIGKETHEREWVNWEIKEAARDGKNIVGVYLYGEKGSEVPKGLERYGNSLVGWNNIDRIVDAIRGQNTWNQNRSTRITSSTDYTKCR